MLINLLTNLRDLAHAAADELLAHLPGARPLIEDPAPITCAVPGCRRRPTVGRLCGYGPVGRDDQEDGGHFAELGRWLRDIQAEAERLDYDPDDPDAWAALPSMDTRWDRTGGSSLASLRAPAVLDVLVHTDRRSTAHGWQHIGPTCDQCPGKVARFCTCPPLPWPRAVHYDSCPRHGVHPSCLVILADRDEHDARAERPLHVLGVLHELAQRVRDERMLGIPVRSVVVRVPPGHEGVYVVEPNGTIGASTLVPDPPTLAGERDVLTRNLDWIAAQPWVLAMREQLAELRAQLMRANGNQDDRPLTGWCYKHIDDQGTECGGNLWPVYTAHTSGGDDDGSGPMRPREVVCDRNPTHRWKGGRGGDLARLAMTLERQQREAEKPRAAVRPAPAAGPRPALPAGTYVAGAGGRLDPLLAEQERLEEADRG